MFRNKDHLAKMTGQRAAPSTNQAQAAEYFEQFINASSLKNLLGYFRTMCELLHLRPTYYNQFYPKLKSSLNNWKAKAIWKKLDARANHKCYAKGKIGEKTRVLIIGAGPCGLRTAIEAQLLGAKVVIIEKRDKLSRNNVLHLWPFVIEDLRTLGAKKFFGKFCAGAIDHISIRQLQCILFKVALILGVEIHTEVSFEGLVQPDPTEKIGWRAELEPENHPVSQYEFDVIIGADGKRNTLQGFKRKEFRGKLAIAITANFINKRTEAEARVEEISGVAFIFNQKFFKDLYQETGIDLENIVYYKDDTHYFVMTAKKPSLLEKGVIIQDLADTERLLAPDNVNREALLNYAKEAAEFSTHYQLPDLEFAVNHYGQPDVAMFDFTSMYAAENASKIIERHGYQLLMILVGDSLLEPFWPTGSGCARGFLSALDAAWSIRSWSMGKSTPLEVLAERESIYRLLAQTTPDNLNKDWKSYTLDPSTRYPNLNRNQVTAHQVVGLFDTDDIQNIEKVERLGEDSINAVGNARKRRRDNVDTDVLINWVKNQLKNHEDIEITDMTSIFHTGKALCAIVNRYRPDLLDYSTIVNNKPSENNHLVIDILEKDLGIPPIMTGEEMSQTEDLLTLSAYLTQIYDTFRTEIPHVKHPKLELPESKMASTSFKTIMQNTQAHLNIGKPSSHKRHLDVSLSAKNSNLDRKARKKRSSDKIGTNIDHENKLPVQRNTDEDFAAKIKNMEDRWNERPVVDKKPKDLLRSIGKIETSDWNIKEIEKKIKENKLGKPINKDREKVPKWSREQFVARQTKLEKLDRQDSSEAKYADIDKNIRHLELKLKEGTNRDLGQNKVATITEKLVSKIPEKTDTVVQKTNPQPAMIIPTPNASEFCHFCKKRVYLMERLSAEGRFFHHGCFKCQYCKAQLRLGSYAFDKDGIYDNKFFCLHHYGMQGELPSRVSRKPSQRRSSKKLLGVAGVDLLDRVQTPERVEFSNLSVSRGSSDQEEEMDEDEWTDRNFGASTAELDSSDEESSSYSDSDSDGEDAYEEAMEEPVTKEGTMKWAERMNKRHYSKHCRSDSDEYSSSDSSSYYENTTDDDDSDTATEGEEEIKARELRLQEVRLEPPIILNDTGTDTEVVSDENSSDISNSVQNSATEISTDSEFAQDDPTPTSEVPPNTLNMMYVTMTRGSSSNPKRIQVTSGFVPKTSNTKPKHSPKRNVELKLTPLVSPSPVLRNLNVKPSEGYALNRTQSTGGIATKVSLELKKKYLLGEASNVGNIQKSGSASTLDTKLKTFHSNISDCQKLLKPAPQISASMQTFCNKLDEYVSPILSPLANNGPYSKLQEGNENNIPLPPPDLIKNTTVESPEKFENVLEGRPRSPVHETSLIVPQIDWSKKNQKFSSLSTSTSSSSEEEPINSPNVSNLNIPVVHIHQSDDIIEENEQIQNISETAPNLPETFTNAESAKKSIDNNSMISDTTYKSITSEKKHLNMPKILPGLKTTDEKKINDKKNPSEDKSSECSTPISGAELTAALTETELSDWARDGGVSDDLEGVTFDLNLDDDKNVLEIEHVCGKTTDTSNFNQINSLDTNFDSIEFMDTCTESYSEDIVGNEFEYKIFKDEEIMEDSLNPTINEIIQKKEIQNSGYCKFEHDNSFGGEVIDLKPSDLENLKLKQNLTEREEDSLLIIEPGTTTEENTCSDSTVKNVTEISRDLSKDLQKQRLEEKLTQLKKEDALLKAILKDDQEKEQSGDPKTQNFETHINRLKSRIDFCNAKDSIDVRKSRRKSRESSKCEIIAEFNPSASLKDITLNLTPTIKTPEQIYKKEIIEKERDINQKLIQEMVMSKMRAEKKPMERKLRNRQISNMSFQLSKSPTSNDIVSKINLNNVDSKLFNGYSDKDKQNENILQKSKTSPNIPRNIDEKNSNVLQEQNKNYDIIQATNHLRQNARDRAKLLTNEDLGLSPEDRIIKLREKVRRFDRNPISLDLSEFRLYSSKDQNAPFIRSTSQDNTRSTEKSKSTIFTDSPDPNKLMCKSESSLMELKHIKKKDSPRKQTKFTKIMDLFSKKTPKGLFSKISPRFKESSKEPIKLSKDSRVKSVPEVPQRVSPVPPPVPPLPSHYTEKLLRNSDLSSEDDYNYKIIGADSTDTLDSSILMDDSIVTTTSTKSGKHRRRSARESQLKRHRMAQEIQRKLEETEVKTRELEERGVVIEKALRGEDTSKGKLKHESEYLQEWFDIMRDRTELRRYEKELMIRAQELELEDRHARLQHQLRKRLKEGNKTEEDKEVDYLIINEMLEIVSKRDSLVALLEEDRLRYLNEDKDFEEQMLAKDLYVTPKWKDDVK